MRIFSSQNFIGSASVFFENHLLTSLTAQQKKICLVAVAIFGALASAILISRYCFLAKKQPVEPIKKDVHNVEKVKAVTSQVQNLLKEESLVGKEEAFEKLEEAFAILQAIDPKKKNWAALFSQILGRYGKRVYPQFEEAISYLLASLQLQLQNLGVLTPRNFDKLTSLKQIDQIPTDSYTNLVELIKNTKEEDFQKLIKDLTEEEKFEFTLTLSILAGIYSNLKEGYLHMEKASFLEFLNRFYKGIEGIYKSMEQTPAIQEQLGELQYNVFPSLYLDQCALENDCEISHDLFQSFNLLDQALVYNPSAVMQARIANLKACRIYFYLQDVSLAMEYAVESLEIWEKVLQEAHLLTPAEAEKYGILYANANNNYLNLMLQMEHPDLEEMEKHAKISREFYQKAKGTHPYCMILANNLACLEKVKGNYKQALQYLDEIANISKHYQVWPHTKICLEKADKLRQEIEDIPV